MSSQSQKIKYFFFFFIFIFLVEQARPSIFFSSLESYNAHVVICVVVFQYLWQQYGPLSSPSTPPTPVWGIARFRRAPAFTSFLVCQNNKQQQTKKGRRSRTPLRSSCWLAAPPASASLSRGGNRCCCYLGGSTCSPPEW